MNPAVKKRKRGGQPKPASQRKRNNLTIRVLDELRERLEKAAEKSQRSVSEEAAYRMMLSFMLTNELKDYEEIRKDTDNSIKAVMARRGWGKIVDPRYGGAVYIPPGQHAIPRSGFISDEEAAAAPTFSEVAEATAALAAGDARHDTLHQAIKAAVTEALPAALESAVEKAVTAALSRATLRIGEDG